MHKTITIIAAVFISLIAIASVLAAAAATADAAKNVEIALAHKVVNPTGGLCLPKLSYRWEAKLDQPKVLHILCM
jgi:hypothetical protein